MGPKPVKPLIAIVGTTGTGKSDLAVEIARKHNGEIINGDAMQLYHGLPIITNKISQEEMKGVPHHLLGCIGLQEETWTVGKFVSQALKTIDDIHGRGKLPILVGGTHYYTQSLLFQDVLADELKLSSDGKSEDFPILQEPTETILEKLKEVDPIMAERWHPNERRKIQRSLEIYLRTGKPASRVYDEQRARKEATQGAVVEGSTFGDFGLRFPTLVFWVHAERDVLYPRLDGRVDKMLARGLLDEVQELSTFRHKYELNTNTELDQTRGIWVSIGYKEFLGYQDALQKNVPSQELEKSKRVGIEKTQAATRQYANRQLKWIRIKLLNALLGADQKDKTFVLDGSDLSQWNESVVDPALNTTEMFLMGQNLPVPSEVSPTAAALLIPKREYDLGQRPDLWQKKVCDVCGTVAVTENDWTLHIKSRAHRRAVGVKKKEENSKPTEVERRKAVQTDMVDVLESYVGTSPQDDASKPEDC